MKKLILAIIFTSSTFAFVENVTKGYPNCMACHVSATGGGILNDYGRSLSANLMSTWKVKDGFERPFYGLGKNTENLKLGGDFRSIQVHSENDKIKIGKSFVMQNNVEFAYQYAKAFVVGTIGRQEGPTGTPRKDKFLSERHFVQLESSPDSRVRIGKFRQSVGTYEPNHTRLAKQSLGFGSNSEAYNLDYTKFHEWGEYNLSTSLGDFFTDKDFGNSEKNYAFNFTHYLGGNSRVGFTLLTGKTDSVKRDLIGLNATTGFFKNGIYRSELYLQTSKSLGSLTSRTKGLYGYQILGYKLFKGFLGYAIFEHQQTDISNHETLIHSPGLGFQFLPIPHVEVQVEYQRRVFESAPGSATNTLFAVLHLYH